MNETTFTFDDVCITPDRQIGHHSHPQWELSHVICGNGSRTIGGCTAAMNEGEIVLIPPNISHVWHFEPSRTDKNGNIANITVLFESRLLNSLEIIFPELVNTIRKIKAQTEALCYAGESHSRILELLHAMKGLSPLDRLPKFLELLRALALVDDCIPVGRNQNTNRVLQKLDSIRIFCNCNYSRNITIAGLASYVGMHKSSLCTFMRRHTGMSLSEYVNDIRLKNASYMLRHTDKSIAEIAYDCGFSNVTYFNRLFKNKYKCTPKIARMEKIDASLREYVETHIIPRYAEFDKAHQADHVNMVIGQSLKLAASDPKINCDMVYAAAAFHDLGLINGRENHHRDSRKILENDKFIRAHFTPDQIRIMGEAVEDHRASKSGKPRNEYGLIVAEADRFIDGETIIRRTVQYGLKNYAELDREGHYQRTLKHLSEKYGRNGYLKIWFPHSDNAKRLEELRKTIADPAAIRGLFERIYQEETEA